MSELKCIMLYFAAVILGLPLTCFAEGQSEKTAGIITQDAFGFYHIDGNPESLDLKMADGGIVFSRGKAFHIGVTYPGKDFCWNDNGTNFVVCYDGKTLFDFNRDFLFDFLHETPKYYIRFDGKFIEVNKPDFQAMQATDSNGKIYHWNGSNWIKQQ